jgi:hypothetical protein
MGNSLGSIPWLGIIITTCEYEPYEQHTAVASTASNQNIRADVEMGKSLDPNVK